MLNKLQSMLLSFIWNDKKNCDLVKMYYIEALTWGVWESQTYQDMLKQNF